MEIIMAAGTIFDVSTSINQAPLTLVFKYDYEEPQRGIQPDAITFTLFVKTNGVSAEIKAIATFATQSINLTFNSIDPQSLCLIGCAGKALIKPLIDCFNTDVNKYIDCLKSKGLSIAVEIAECAIGCLPLLLAQKP
jgi:hypothetical protein